MGTMQTALTDVGFRPRLRTLRRAAERERLALETVVDGVFEPLIKNRKVVVQRAGGYYKARYVGQAACCFGETPEEASCKLKYLPRSASNRMKFDEVKLWQLRSATPCIDSSVTHKI